MCDSNHTLSAYRAALLRQAFAYLALSNDGEDGMLDVVGVMVEVHVTQHHDTAENKSSWVGLRQRKTRRRGTGLT